MSGVQVVGEPRRTTQTLGTAKALMIFLFNFIMFFFPLPGLANVSLMQQVVWVLPALPTKTDLRLPVSGDVQAGQSTGLEFGPALKGTALNILTMGLSHVINTSVLTATLVRWPPRAM